MHGWVIQTPLGYFSIGEKHASYTFPPSLAAQVQHATFFPSQSRATSAYRRAFPNPKLRLQNRIKFKAATLSYANGLRLAEAREMIESSCPGGSK